MFTLIFFSFLLSSGTPEFRAKQDWRQTVHSSLCAAHCFRCLSCRAGLIVKRALRDRPASFYGLVLSYCAKRLWPPLLQAALCVWQPGMPSAFSNAPDLALGLCCVQEPSLADFYCLFILCLGKMHRPGWRIWSACRPLCRSVIFVCP